MNKDQKSVFAEIISPLLQSIQKADSTLNEREQYKLSLIPFTLNLVFGIINRIKSIRLLITEIKTNPTAQELGMVNASSSMYNEAFNRYKSSIFREIFSKLVLTLEFINIPEIKHLGRFLLVDGSLFPALINMQWADYKKTAKAVKLHLAFELNKMIPVQFISTEGNYSEKKFLKGIIEEGVTYICDRGYLCFSLFKEIVDKKAFFIIRGKENLVYTVREQLIVNIPDKFSHFIDNVFDLSIQFTNDINNITYRLISFTAMGEHYTIITNRYDLSTYQIIMLYAYRWQIELMFRFLKRTTNGIHLLSQSQNGIEVQFYLFLISFLLILNFKQKCAVIDDLSSSNNEDGFTSNNEEDEEANCVLEAKDNFIATGGRQYVCGLVSLLGDGLKRYWKIGLHWLTALKNYLLKPFNIYTVRELMAIE